MRKTVFVVLVLALLGLVAAAGCISTPEETATPVGVWLVPGQDVTLVISPDGTYGGSAQVNSFSGIYTVEGDKLTFGVPALMNAPGGLEEEQAFFTALTSVDSFFVVEGGKLVLKSGEEIVLILIQSIAGTWSGENGIFLTFNTDMTLSGSGPVNGFSGTYTNTLEGLVISVDVVTTGVGSDEDMEAEAAFFAALSAAKDYSVSGGKLTLLDAVTPEKGNALLTLAITDVGAFMNQYGDTLVFNADGTFSGQAPVNTFKGTYEVIENGKKIVLNDFSMTKMAGSEEDMENEAAFLEALAAEDYTFERGQMLTGYGEDGEVIHVFIRT